MLILKYNSNTFKYDIILSEYYQNLARNCSQLQNMGVDFTANFEVDEDGDGPAESHIVTCSFGGTVKPFSASKILQMLDSLGMSLP